MKTSLKICCLLAGFAAMNVSAANYVFIAQDPSLETKLCVNAGRDNTSALRHTMNSDHHSYRYTANTVFCNGKSMAQFAHQYGAINTHAFLKRFTSDKNQIKSKVTITDLARQASSDNDAIAYSGNENETVYVMVSAH